MFSYHVKPDCIKPSHHLGMLLLHSPHQHLDFVLSLSPKGEGGRGTIATSETWMTPTSQEKPLVSRPRTGCQLRKAQHKRSRTAISLCNASFARLPSTECFCRLDESSTTGTGHSCISLLLKYPEIQDNVSPSPGDPNTHGSRGSERTIHCIRL